MRNGQGDDRASLLSDDQEKEMKQWTQTEIQEMILVAIKWTSN